MVGERQRERERERKREWGEVRDRCSFLRGYGVGHVARRETTQELPVVRPIKG